ncbi:protein kinase [bacterium]|nr:protein kinase [bacterium]
MALRVGERLQDRYLVREAIKSGGMGSVFLAYDDRLQGLCAVKEMHPSEDEWATRRFREEATTLSRLQHAGIPKVRDFFVQDGLHYLVMDYVAGDTLAVEAGSMTGAQAHKDLLEILSILDYLHGLDPAIIHRDIKPGNLIRERQSGRLILVDFGLARSISDNTQTTAGTVMFCSPEQMVGKGTVRSDLYSLAATYYVLLTGLQIQMGCCKPILFHRPDLPPELAEVLDTALRLDPEQRYASAREMRQALLGQGTPLKRPRPRPPLWTLVLAGFCAGGYWVWPRPSPSPQPPSPSPSVTVSPTRVPAPTPVLVFAPEQGGWGLNVQPGQQPEEVLAKVLEQSSLQGVNGRPVVLYDSSGRVLKVGILLPEGSPPPKGLASFRLPDGQLAWLVVTGDYEQLPAERNRLREWINGQGLKPGSQFYEVRRIGEANQSKAERWETDLCWPVRRSK